MRTAIVISLSLPPDMEKEIKQAAKEERRTISEFMREAIRSYMARRDLAYFRKKGRKIAKRLKITEDDIVRIVKEGRK